MTNQKDTVYFKSEIFNNETNLHMKINIRTNELLRPSGRCIVSSQWSLATLAHLAFASLAICFDLFIERRTDPNGKTDALLLFKLDQTRPTYVKNQERLLSKLY